jgi:hypothetical protein
MDIIQNYDSYGYDSVGTCNVIVNSASLTQAARASTILLVDNSFDYLFCAIGTASYRETPVFFWYTA